MHTCTYPDKHRHSCTCTRCTYLCVRASGLCVRTQGQLEGKHNYFNYLYKGASSFLSMSLYQRLRLCMCLHRKILTQSEFTNLKRKHTAQKQGVRLFVILCTCVTQTTWMCVHCRFDQTRCRPKWKGKREAMSLLCGDWWWDRTTFLLTVAIVWISKRFRFGWPFQTENNLCANFSNHSCVNKTCIHKEKACVFSQKLFRVKVAKLW